jgi:osmotically-inducible protein OsmY
MNKTDNQLKQDIETELLWDPKLNAAQIGVSVDNGAVTLLGAVDTYPQKWAAADAAKRVSGVRTVAQDLTVKLLSDHKRTDSDIAAAIQSALKWNVYVPSSVTARVQDGVVTLEGQVGTQAHEQDRQSAETGHRNRANF